jgi:hypothetical protein
MQVGLHAGVAMLPQPPSLVPPGDEELRMLGAGPSSMLKKGKLFPLCSRCSDDGSGEVVASHFGAASVRVEGRILAWLQA